jgi:prolyl-tRNA synthetase
MLALHSDDLGLVVNPKVAPIQVVIIPILKKEKEEKILDYARKIKETLEKSCISVLLDKEKEKRPGYKYYYYDIKGIPLRIDVGEKEVEENSIIIVRRDTKEKIRVSLEEITEKVKEVLSSIEVGLFNKAKEEVKKRLEFVNDLESIKSKGVKLAFMCESEEHSKLIENETGKEVLGFLEGSNINLSLPKEGKCIICGKKTTKIAVIGKKY